MFFLDVFKQPFTIYGVFTLPDTETDTETDKMACTVMCGGLHTAQIQTPIQILIGFCTHFIGICVSLCLDVAVRMHH